jgi:opacity protein-like surface antigen
MSKRGIVTVAVGLFLIAGVAPASAQGRVEVSGFVGFSIADGVESDPILAGDGNIYDTIEPDDSAVYGFTVGVLAGEGAELGFRWAQQPTSLLASGTSERTIGDMTISSYHGYFAYNFGEADAKMRPFVLIGLGATNFGSIDATVAGVSRSIGGETQFSTTWAGGVKIFPAPKVGIRLAFEWTPTYIKTDSVGWWCDPYWGCYLVGNAQYSNSLQFNGGVTVRF